MWRWRRVLTLCVLHKIEWKQNWNCFLLEKNIYIKWNRTLLFLCNYKLTGMVRNERKYFPWVYLHVYALYLLNFILWCHFVFDNTFRVNITKSEDFPSKRSVIQSNIFIIQNINITYISWLNVTNLVTAYTVIILYIS